MAANDHLSAERSGDEEALDAMSTPVDGSGEQDGAPPSAPAEGLTPEPEASPEAPAGETDAGAERVGTVASPEDESAEPSGATETAELGDEARAAEEVGGEEPAQEGVGAPEPSAEAPAQLPEVPQPPRKRHHVAPALVALDRVIDDETFRIRPEGDLSLLATDIARLGQLFPVDLRLVPPNGFQVISGFRRVAALRFLQRDKVLARLHTDLDDEDALLMALAAAIHSVPVEAEQLSAVKDRLEGEGRLSAAARDMLEKALSEGEGLAPEGPVVEIDADELAVDVTARLGAINQDLALLADVFGSLDEARRAELLDQLRYSSELVAFLEGQR